MAPCIQLHRFLQLQDKERTHLFTFLVENPHEISTFDVRSREFHFAGHRWYVYTGKPNNEYFSFYLRIVNLGKDVRVHTVYSFNVINLVNCQNNYTYFSPPGGRIFSRNDDALSWGWKEFIRRETLLKPNGGFLFDGNKSLVELECKSYKTIIEETIQLPLLTPNHPFPMIHTSPFSVGGFAWQIRIFPDGPDEDNKGNVALFLHCTTANHLVKVKARFLIEGQPSPVIYEHTFPANCISEMPSGVAFPNRSEFMKSLTDNKLRVGIEFVAVTEVNEVHVTLSEPTTYPTVCVTPFEDLSGCPWVLKTLQANKLKLKLDQNEKTTSGLMEFYHRHVIWNATLVAPSADDCSMNIPLNTKGSLIGYFGENWSDADVIKSDVSIEDLTIDDNIYRTDVDDGYDRYSYISLHVEILSNHLLYKTPAPSPTGDRERKLLYNARKDRAQLHTKYQELLRHKTALESKCHNLERERSRLGMNNQQQNVDENDVTKEEIVPDFTKLLFDLMSDLSRRATLKNRQPSFENDHQKPYHPPPPMNEKEINKKYQEYRNDFSLLVKDSRLKPSKSANLQEKVNEIHHQIIEYIETKSGIRITNTVISGSLGTDTCSSNRLDVDIHLYSPNLPHNGHMMWLPSFVVGLKILLQDATNEGKFINLSQITCSSYSVQMVAYGEIDIDIYPSFDWQHDVTATTSSSSGYDGFYEELLRQRTSENLCWFSPDVAELQKIFILEQPEQVKSAIRVVKQWRNDVDWKEYKWKPPSYLIILLIIRSYENLQHDTSSSNNTSSHNTSSNNTSSNNTSSIRNIIKYFIKLVLSTSTHKPARIKISWSRFYDPNDYNIEYNGAESRDCPPIVQDPANPANNVAERPISWIPFRRNIQLWANRLHLIKDSVIHSENKKVASSQM